MRKAVFIGIFLIVYRLVYILHYVCTQQSLSCPVNERESYFVLYLYEELFFVDIVIRDSFLTKTFFLFLFWLFIWHMVEIELIVAIITPLQI